MRRSLTAALAALTLASSIASPALAGGDRHGRRHHHRNHDGDAAAAAVVAGLFGLAIGAAISHSKRNVSYAPAPMAVPPPPLAPQPDAEGWYGPYAEPSHDGCFMQRWVFDREAGRTIPERRPVDCLEAAR